MKHIVLRAVSVFGVAVLLLGLVGFWCLRVTPVTVANLSGSTLGNVAIDFEGCTVWIGTLTPLEARKHYAIPHRGELISVSFMASGRAARGGDYVGGSEGQQQIVVILPGNKVQVVSSPDLLLK